MTTIYKFIVETQARGSNSDGRKGGEIKPDKKTPSKKGRWVSILGGEKGGVEHNRKLRAINPLLNRITGGYWEKGLRVGRAAAGLITRNTATGAFGISSAAFAILIAFVIQAVLKVNAKQRTIADSQNTQNFKSLENGIGAVHGSYNVSVNLWHGAYTYNENK